MSKYYVSEVRFVNPQQIGQHTGSHFVGKDLHDQGYSLWWRPDFDILMLEKDGKRTRVYPCAAVTFFVMEPMPELPMTTAEAFALYAKRLEALANARQEVSKPLQAQSGTTDASARPQGSQPSSQAQSVGPVQAGPRTKSGANKGR